MNIYLRMCPVKQKTWLAQIHLTQKNSSLRLQSVVVVVNFSNYFMILFLIILTFVCRRVENGSEAAFAATNRNSALKLIRVKALAVVRGSTAKMLSNLDTIPPTITVLENNLQNNGHIEPVSKIYGITFVFTYTVINCYKESWGGNTRCQVFILTD